jgi:hypothetical protein
MKGSFKLNGFTDKAARLAKAVRYSLAISSLQSGRGFHFTAYIFENIFSVVSQRFSEERKLLRLKF